MFRPVRPATLPMPRRLRPVVACLLALGLSARAVPALADPSGFTASQRAEIVRIVRDALKTDPSILNDAIMSLRAQAQQKEAADTRAALAANRPALNGQPGDAILGNPAGDVTVVEFYDPRCPYCRKVLPDLDTLLASDHGIRLVEKLIPILGPNSTLEAQAIQAAALQGRYAALQQALMTDSGTPGLARIRSVAGSAGLDVPRLVRDMASPAVEQILERNVALAHAIGLTGTPTFVIGDAAIPGAVELPDLRQAIAAVRQKS